MNLSEYQKHLEDEREKCKASIENAKAHILVNQGAIQAYDIALGEVKKLVEQSEPTSPAQG